MTFKNPVGCNSSKKSPVGYLIYLSLFQALGKDRLYPGVHFFARGFGANNDPLRGYVAVFFVALGMTMIGGLVGKVAKKKVANVCR